MGWKIYSWLISLIFIMIVISNFVSGKVDILTDIDAVITGGTIVGLICYAYKKRVISKLFWKIFFFGSIAWALIYMFGLDIIFHHEAVNFSSILFNILFPLPIYFAIYLYAFHFFGSKKVILPPADSLMEGPQNYFDSLITEEQKLRKTLKISWYILGILVAIFLILLFIILAITLLVTVIKSIYAS